MKARSETCRFSACFRRPEVQEYGYVGGFYGASREANIMEEIYRRGPVAIAIEPQDDFMSAHSREFKIVRCVFKVVLLRREFVVY